MPHVLDNDAILKLERVCDNLRDRLLVRLGYLAGPRASELVGTDAPRRADLEAGRLRMPVKKRESGYWRWIPLDETTRDLLRAYIAELRLKPGDPLFQLSRSSATNRVKELARRAGLQPLTPPDGAKRRQWGVSIHRLRDFSFTKRLTDQKIKEAGWEGVKAVADFHGHKDPRSTLRYLRMAEGWRETVFEAGMEELLHPAGAAEEPE